MTTSPPTGSDPGRPDPPPPGRDGWRSLADASWRASGDQSPAQPQPRARSTASTPDDPVTTTTRSGRFRPGIGALIVLASMAAALLGGTLWVDARGSDDTPRVTLLGTGSSLSVLVTAGEARVLIAAGDDPAAAGRALDAARALQTDRIDLLVVAGTGADLAVPAGLVSDDTRRVVRLGAAHPDRRTGDLPDDITQVPAEARIDVAPGVTLVLETVEIPDPDTRGDFTLAWRAVVRMGASTVTVLSDTAHASRFPPLASTGVLVAASGDVEDLDPLVAGALVVSGHDVEGSELRTELPPLVTTAIPAIRVHDGDAVWLTLTEAGVELPADHVVLVGPTPPTT